jgi:hypothetical protein
LDQPLGGERAGDGETGVDLRFCLCVQKREKDFCQKREREREKKERETGENDCKQQQQQQQNAGERKRKGNTLKRTVKQRHFAQSARVHLRADAGDCADKGCRRREEHSFLLVFVLFSDAGFSKLSFLFSLHKKENYI